MRLFEAAFFSRAVHLVDNSGAQASISSYGGQLLSWTSQGRERLYLSPRATFAAGLAIRGGVPVIFPQFSDRGRGPRHGFARLSEWERLPGSDTSEARFCLREDETTLKVWPHPFRAELAVGLSTDTLSIGLRVINTGPDTVSFTAALHTYLRIDDLASARLYGLEGRRFLDSTRNGAASVQPDSPLRFEEETDRIYPDVPAALHLHDGGSTLCIQQDGFRDVVVWNPGARLAARIGDLGQDEHARFVCAEAAQVASPVQVAPGGSWQGQQVLTVVRPAEQCACVARLG